MMTAEEATEVSPTVAFVSVSLLSSAVISLKVGTSLGYHLDSVLLTPKRHSNPLVNLAISLG